MTGFLSPTAAIHKVAGDLFVERLNAAGGLLGREVVWDVRDDESVNENAAAIYERLITEYIDGEPLDEYATGKRHLRDREAIDVYDVDAAYWRSFWHR